MSSSMVDLKPEPEGRRSALRKDYVVSVIACAAYSITSMVMTFSNKSLLLRGWFTSPMFLLLYQNIFSASLLYGCMQFRLLEMQHFKWDLVKKWLPLIVFFVLMLITGQFGLSFLSVAMVTIFKNFTTIAITIGDRMIFGQEIPPGVGMSLLVMFVGSVVAGLNDLEYNGYGYLWMMANCVSQTCYALYIKKAIKDTELSHVGAAFYNNVLSIPFVFLMVWFDNGLTQVLSFAEGDGVTLEFIVYVIFNGFCASAISLATFWAVNTTSPTTYSVVGALNKIPLTVLSSIVYRTKFNLLGGLSTGVSLLGGVIYSLAKHRQAKMRLRGPKGPIVGPILSHVKTRTLHSVVTHKLN